MVYRGGEKKDGAGNKFDENSKVSKDMTVYTVWEDVTETEEFYVEAFQNLGLNIQEALIAGANILVGAITSLITALAFIFPFALVFLLIGYVVYKKKF